MKTVGSQGIQRSSFGHFFLWDSIKEYIDFSGCSLPGAFCAMDEIPQADCERFKALCLSIACV